MYYTFKGPWADNVKYNANDVVIYAADRKVYHLQRSAPAGAAPHDTRYWGQLNDDLALAVIMMNQCIEIAINGALTGKVANNLTTTASGKVLDARQGKALKDLIDALTGRVEDVEEMLPTPKTLRLASSTAESDKVFDITVDDDGELTATEYTPEPPEEADAV